MTHNNPLSQLHYRTTGSGPLVILLHGLLMDGSSWEANGLVDHLRADFTVVTPDLPGHGQSAHLRGIGYDQQSQARLVRDIIAALGYQKAHVVGYSSGAWLALGLMKYAPDWLSSVVIGGWDVAHGLPEGPDGRLDYETFFAFAQATAPELTRGVTAEHHPALRACFNALSDYQGQRDAPRVSQSGLPALFWAGADDIYHPPLKSWCESQGLPFITTRGDHLSAISVIEPAMLNAIRDRLLGRSPG